MRVIKLTEGFVPSSDMIRDVYDGIHTKKGKVNGIDVKDGDIDGILDKYIDGNRTAQSIQYLLKESSIEFGTIDPRENTFVRILGKLNDSTLRREFDKLKYLLNMCVNGKLFPTRDDKDIADDIAKIYGKDDVYKRSEGDFQYTINAYVMLKYHKGKFFKNPSINENIMFDKQGNVLTKKEIFDKIEELSKDPSNVKEQGNNEDEEGRSTSSKKLSPSDTLKKLKSDLKGDKDYTNINKIPDELLLKIIKSIR